MENGSGWYSEIDSALEAARSQGKPVLLQFHRDECSGCKKMIASTYSDPQAHRELMQWFVPVEQDILKDRSTRSMYSAYWTPSFFFLNNRGKMLYAFNGYLGAEDFRVVLRLGKAALDLPRGRYVEVIDLMDDGLEQFSANPRAAAMLFTRGMAEYLLGKEKHAFRSAMEEIVELYPDSAEAGMWPWMDAPPNPKMNG